jgi:hypothetical protein
MTERPASGQGLVVIGSPLRDEIPQIGGGKGGGIFGKVLDPGSATGSVFQEGPGKPVNENAAQYDG